MVDEGVVAHPPGPARPVSASISTPASGTTTDPGTSSWRSGQRAAGLPDRASRRATRSRSPCFSTVRPWKVQSAGRVPGGGEAAHGGQMLAGQGLARGDLGGHQPHDAARDGRRQHGERGGVERRAGLGRARDHDFAAVIAHHLHQDGLVFGGL